MATILAAAKPQMSLGRLLDAAGDWAFAFQKGGVGHNLCSFGVFEMLTFGVYDKQILRAVK